MKVRILASMAGTNHAYAPGDEADLDSDEAIRLIDAGFAELLREEKIERAVARPRVERTAKKDT